MSIEIFKLPLMETIGHKRYNHSLRVMETAEELAIIYGVSAKKTRIAAVLHDCGRLKDCNNLKKQFDSRKIVLDRDTESNRNLHHAVLGRFIAYDNFCITDMDILNAVRYHTTGRPGMSLLEKIVYLADAIEDKREYEGIKEIRKMSLENIDEAMKLSLLNTCSYLKNSNTNIHKNTIECLEWLNGNTTGGTIGK